MPYSLKIAKSLTAEEKLLSQKYKVLREKKEAFKTLTSPKPVFPSYLKRETEKKDIGAGGHENRKMALERAKQLVAAGRISIRNPHEQQNKGFKRSTTLKRKLADGNPAKRLKTSPTPSSSSVEDFVASAPEPKYQFQAYNSPASAPTTTTSAAGLEWSRSIGRNSRNGHSGDYYDYKRRVVKYDDGSSSSDDD